MSKKEAIEKIAGLLGEDVLSMSTINNEGDLTRDGSVSSKDNSSAKGKITLEEFFARTDKVVLNIPTQEEFSALVKIFKDLGITTNSGREFKEGMWKNFEHLTIISPERKIGGGVEFAKYKGYEVINFKDLDLEKYLSQEELTKLGIEISSKEVEKEVESVNNSNSSHDNQLLPNQYKITIDEFWEQQNKQLAIHCDEEWKANILMKVFDKMGKTWGTGSKYTQYNNFDRYKSDTCYSCRGGYCGISQYEEYKYVIYPFDQVDLSKYLTQEQVEEIKNKLGFDPLQNNQSTNTQGVQSSVTQNTQSQNVKTSSASYDITVDEFWEQQNKRLAIHCDEEWKANILMKVFDRMGKTWGTGSKYTQYNNFDRYKSDTCYSCRGGYCNISSFEKDKYVIYPFDQVDLSKYLTQEEVEEIKNKLGFNPLQNNQSVQTQGVQSSVTQNNQGNNTQKQNVQNSQNAQSQKVSTPSVSYDITADEFWQSISHGKKLVIHCDEEWKAKVLIDVFKKMFKYNDKQAKDFYQDYVKYGSRTCYSNDWTLSPKDWFERNDVPVYPFEKVDLSKYLTQKDVNTIISMSGIWRKYLKPEDIKEMLDSLGFGYLFTDDMTLQ